MRKEANVCQKERARARELDRELDRELELELEISDGALSDAAAQVVPQRLARVLTMPRTTNRYRSDTCVYFGPVSRRSDRDGEIQAQALWTARRQVAL